MEKIDLTKCNNLRYKAKVDGNDDYGRICVENADTGLAFLRSDREDEYVAVWHCDEMLIRGISGREVTDFEIVPRDPETYQDWQVGDRVHYPNGDNDIVIFRSGELVVLADDFTEENSDVTAVNTCSQLFDRRDGRLVLTDIEQQIIGEKKKYEPQDGDIVAWKDADDDGDSAVSIYKAKHRSYITLFTTGSCYVPEETLAMGIARPATEEEKQKLFDAMAKEGKRWNAEKKVVEDIPKPYEFRKGEPVLVKDEGGRWRIGVFIQRENSFYGYITRPADGVGEIGYRFCLPYNERTMHLLGTMEDYKEEQR